MGPSRWVVRSVVVMSVGGTVLAGAVPAVAQQYEASLRSLDYFPDPLARSPRLLGMGRLTLADDLHNRITLWDFAGNPTGIAESESLSTIEYRPVIRSSSAMRDLPGLPVGRERQELAARQQRHSFETWHRASGQAAYGLLAEVATLQLDRPYDGSIERRGRFTVPGITAAVNGRVPWVPSDRFDFALRLGHALEQQDDLYYDFYRLPQGDYLGKPTAAVPPPDVFTPTRAEISTLSGGVAISARVASGIQAAIGYDRTRTKVRSKNEGLRSISRTDEARPFDIGQASVIGRIGTHLEWGADGRAWRSESEETFFWSVSAGPTEPSLSGNGKRLDREEEGTSLRTRARWVDEAFELGAGFNTTFRRARIAPWYPASAGDPAGFNDFLDLAGFRLGADTLMLPPRVVASRIEERGYEVTAGGSWRLPGRRGVLGAEVYRWRRRSDQPSVGAGPEPTGWDVRAGGEYRCSATFLARAGWNFGRADRDEFTSVMLNWSTLLEAAKRHLPPGDAFRRVLATSGFGFQPDGSRWSLDLGYAFEWVNPDFADPVRMRETHQHLALQLRWPL